MHLLRWSAIGLVVLAALCAALIAILSAYDWNHAKPWINRRVSEAIDRPFAINGDLSVRWQPPPATESGWRAWIPWPHIRAQDITVGNPGWVTATPNLTRVAQVSLSVVPLPLLRKHLIMPDVLLDAPRLYLQRERDGRNNWTFKKQDNRPSGWEYELQHLTLHRGAVHLVDAIRKADVYAKIESLENRANGGNGIGWTITGSLDGEPVSGAGKAGGILTLQQQGTQYPVEGNLHAGKTVISVKGTLTNPQALAALDLQLKMSGVSLAQLYRISGIVLPETPPFSTEGHLTGTLNPRGGDWRYANFKGRVGSSDIAGTLEYLSREPRALLKGNVTSNLLQFEDLAPLIGADSNANKVRRGAEPVQPQDKVLPVEKFRTERWTSIDADVHFSGRRIVRKKQLPIDHLITQVSLKDGVLSLIPLNFGMAGGTLTSTMRLDGRDKDIKAEMKVAARHLKLKQLFPAFQPMQASLGEINGDASLSGTGNSVAALLGSSNGELKTVIDRGTISKLLLEEMGLNIGNVILAKLFGDRQVQLNCLATDFKVTDGVMNTRMFVVDTADATLTADGKINLANEKLDLTLNPESKGVRVISLRSPLYVTGTFKKPDVSIDKGVLAAKAGGAIALGVLAPVATALLPLVNLGPGKQSECAKILAQANKKPQAPPPGKTATSP